MKRVLLSVVLFLFAHSLVAQTVTISGISLGEKLSDAIPVAKKDFPYLYTGDDKEGWDIIASDKVFERGERDIQINKIYIASTDDVVAAISYKFARYTFSPYGPAFNERNMLGHYEAYYKDLCKLYGNPSAKDGYAFLWELRDALVALSTEYEYDAGHHATYYAIRIDYSSIGNASTNSGDYYASGSGFFLNREGYIATNYHVIEGFSTIDVFVSRNGDVQKYSAKVIITDKQNDLAILKTTDPAINLSTPPYSISFSIKDVGVEVFALGYPMSTVLGEEIKVTDGIISSKSGFQGDITTYQISAPIQPGNSGGPLFSKDGLLIGITNAGVPDAQNVGYAIKTAYLKGLLESAPVQISIPTNNSVASLSLSEKIKRISPYVVLIKVK